MLYCFTTVDALLDSEVRVVMLWFPRGFHFEEAFHLKYPTGNKEFSTSEDKCNTPYSVWVNLDPTGFTLCLLS